MIAHSPDVTRFALKPDLRHWGNIPSEFVFTKRDAQKEKCLLKHPQGYRIILE